MKIRSIETVLGARIAVARREAGLTQEELAERVGLAAQSISRLERGQQMPDLRHLDGIARAVGVELSDLLRRRESERRSRHETAQAHVAALLRERTAEEVERVAAVLEVVFRA